MTVKHPKGWCASRCTRLHVMDIEVIRLNRRYSSSFHMSGCVGIFSRLTTLGAEPLQIKGIPYVNSSFQQHCLSLPNLAIPYGDFVLLKLWEQLQCTHTYERSTTAEPWKWWKTWKSRKQVQGEVWGRRRICFNGLQTHLFPLEKKLSIYSSLNRHPGYECD